MQEPKKENHGVGRGPAVDVWTGRTRDATGRFVQESYVEEFPCRTCGTRVRRRASRRFFCSKTCQRAQSSTRHITAYGYVRIKCPSHPHATSNGWVLEHIVVVTAMLGRPLRRNECVHHKDQNKQNNSPDNLEVVDRALHAQQHGNNPNTRRVGAENPLILCACGCATPLAQYDKKGRPRRFLVGHNCRGKRPAPRGARRLPRMEASSWLT